MELLFRNTSSGNVKHCKSVPKTPTVPADNGNLVQASTSLSSGRELLDVAKPDIKYFKNKKADFENKIFDWITADTGRGCETEKDLDEVDHSLGSIAVMIRRDLNVGDQARLLFELQKYVFGFISMRVDQNIPGQAQEQSQPQTQPQLQQTVTAPSNLLMFAQDQCPPESYMSVLQPL